MCSMCSKLTPRRRHPTNIYLFKINNRNTRKWYKTYSNLTIRYPNDINDVVLVSLLLTLNIFHNFFYCYYCCWLQTGSVNLLNMFKVDKRDTNTTSIKKPNAVFIPLTLNMHLHAGHNFSVDKYVFNKNMFNCFLIDGNLFSFRCVYC